MMLWFRPSPRKVLAKAQVRYDDARSVWNGAYRRQDTRAMHEATAPLQAAYTALLAAELAVSRLPPLPRRGVAA